MDLDFRTWELHNLRKVPGGFRSRGGFVTMRGATSNTVYVGSFSVESPFTSELWHYLFEQTTASGLVILRCFTEEFVEIWSLNLGVLQRDPVITHGVVQNQIMCNSPSFSGPIHGLVGGGLIPATKTESINEDTTALDMLPGHICTFGDRFVIASAQALYPNDPGVDPRTFVAANATPLEGTIYDHMRGPDGALYAFTSGGVFKMASDALGQGQSVAGFISRIPGIETTRPRNACVTGGAVAVLQKDHVVLLPSGTRIDFGERAPRRYFSKEVTVEDLRRSGEMFATPTGFVIGFRGKRSHFVEVNLAEKSIAHITDGEGIDALSLVGTLKTRDGGVLFVTRAEVIAMHTKGLADPNTGETITAIMSGRLPLADGDNPVVRRVTVSADNAAMPNEAAVNGSAKQSTTPTRTGDTIVGTSTWSDSTKHSGRTTRTVRHSFAVRATDPSVEIAIAGGDMFIEAGGAAELTGQGRKRRDRQ